MGKTLKWIFMILILFIVMLFAAIPLALRCSYIQSFLFWFLEPLGDIAFKSVYVEMLGAPLGTFLAVVGALWVQRTIDKTAEERIVQEHAMIVYYDFAFAFQDIENFLQEYYSYDFDLNMIRINFDDISNYKKYKERKKKYRFYIDAEWIHNIAKLGLV